ncbi:hypothetical protein GCM10008949_32490 [Deinococcus humi]|nr:hypothetical protein GCM10008949_32490 [Deinococcus humi]
MVAPGDRMAGVRACHHAELKLVVVPPHFFQGGVLQLVLSQHSVGVPVGRTLDVAEQHDHRLPHIPEGLT